MHKRASLSGRVVVVTGASSGLGRETAVQFARAGCSLVLSARREEDLESTAELCRAAGGTAFTVPADVSVESDVQRLVTSAREAFQRIDVWVNNAGVTLFARLADAPFEEHRRVIEINLLGAMLCARAITPVFREQRRGVLINVGSVLSKIGQPFVPSYVISKFGLRGMSEALRAEFADEPDIHICTVLPYAIDTPHFQSGANQLHQHARAMPPVQAPEKVARAIVQLAAAPRREVHVPRIAALGLALHWLLPNTTERLLLRALARWHFDRQPQQATQGSLYTPVEQGEAQVHGQRTPQLSTERFALWTAVELLRIELERAVRALRRSTTADAPPR
jgi:NAD(P)-dependent dehydrogenase (short-subunit alcohol dehydrogenase family)